MTRISQALAALLAVCVVIRVVAWLIAPALPTLAVLLLVGAVACRLFAGPRFKGFDKFFK